MRFCTEKARSEGIEFAGVCRIRRAKSDNRLAIGVAVNQKSSGSEIFF